MFKKKKASKLDLKNALRKNLRKRKLFKKKQLLIKYYFKKIELEFIIKKSLLRNHYNSYVFRLSFTINELYNKTTKDNKFFNSQQKLLCPFTLDKKIPTKHLLFSRFYLNKQLHTLKVNNVYK